MNCEKCGGECWDNREKVRGGWKGPLWKCKDKSCAWVQWPPKDKPSPKAPGTTTRSNGEPKWTWASLRQTYTRSLVLAVKETREAAASAKLQLTMQDVIAAAATIFIAASRDGVKEIAPKPPVDEEPVLDNEPDEDPF